MMTEKKDSYTLVTEALQAISRLEDSLVTDGPAFPTRVDMDIIQQISRARFSLMNAQAMIHQRENEK